ncbi:CHAT domain-containing protein [Halorussus halophilus]|uniref:hypothetical protein n=1 Tax=Halorussus halophilus TaxID=2650975 RepID=UPI00130184B4|nr:hypothetical protein [Halorussus halophilus]
MSPEITRLNDAHGVEIVDPIESRRFTIRTTGAVSPTPGTTGAFAFPVETVRRIETRGLVLPYAIPMDLRTADGDHCADISPPVSERFPDDEYLIELHAPIKLYFRVDGAFGIEAGTDEVRICFDDSTVVSVGARSYHSSPATTITVPDDPAALLQAVETFSSTLKTTSPERSFPTLRGHPPALERGDRLSIPDELRRPDTGVQLHLPAEYEYVYPAAPLAFYLGAELLVDEKPGVTTDSGFVRTLPEGVEEFNDAVASLLKRVFLLDCVTRTEGFYPVDLAERRVVESHVELDFSTLYEASIDERLEAYASVPDDVISEALPEWHRATHVRPNADGIGLLPYLVYDLSLVYAKPKRDESWEPTEAQRKTQAAIEEFHRSTSEAELVRSARGGTNTVGDDLRSIRSGDGDEATAPGIPDLDEYISLPEVDALEQAWVGDGTPIHGAKLLEEAFERDPPEAADGTIDITVVCNDEKMRKEWDTASEVYASRDDILVDVDTRFDVSTAELRELLERETDVLHFIGHIDGAGFKCSDGILNAEESDLSVGVTTLLLNGCRSHDQGIALVKQGASATVASLWDLPNSAAVEVGETFARLLNYGFTVGSAVKIVEDFLLIGREYVVLGDWMAAISQCEYGVPRVYEITKSDGNKREIEFKNIDYPTRIHNVGSLTIPYGDERNKEFLAIGESSKHTVSDDSFHNLLVSDTEPVVIDKELNWLCGWEFNN